MSALLLKRSAWAAGILFLVGACACDEQKPVEQPPSLDLLLRPKLLEHAARLVEVQLTVSEPKLANGSTALRMPLVIVGIPTARYDGNAIAARDDSGELLLNPQDEPPTPTGTYRRWLASRASVGNVTYTYSAVPRSVSATTRPGPLFDLRAEGEGLNGAGITFLALPDTKHEYRVKLNWDLGALPAGSIGVSSLGESSIVTTATAEQLAFSFYAAGPLKRHPQEGADDFAMYWFGDPPFDTEAVAARIQKLFATMASFFQDPGGAYRVFIRKNPYASGGGTALPRSFMFGYSDASTPTIAELQGLLAHEMTHNWPALQGEHGETAWYSEGNAEYYSILLSYRAGVLTPDEFLQAINERAAAYSTNPLRDLSNVQAAEKFWSDSRAQKIPYGRGFLYLAQVDAQIRARSSGKRSLRDLVLAIRELQNTGKPYGIEQWLDLVTREIGPQARTEFDAMVEGKMVVPPAQTFSPCLRGEAADLPAPDLGFDSGYVATVGAHISGLDPQSAAFRAGARNGDEIAAPIPSADDFQKSPGSAITLKLRRDGNPIEIAFVPSTRQVKGYRWVRAAAMTDEACLKEKP